MFQRCHMYVYDATCVLDLKSPGGSRIKIWGKIIIRYKNIQRNQCIIFKVSDYNLQFFSAFTLKKIISSKKRNGYSRFFW